MRKIQMSPKQAGTSFRKAGERGRETARKQGTPRYNAPSSSEAQLKVANTAANTVKTSLPHSHDSTSIAMQSSTLHSNHLTLAELWLQVTKSTRN